MIDPKRLAAAIAMSLAEDGYIDLAGHDGQQYLDGLPRVVKEIDALAEDIAKQYELVQPEGAK